MPIESSTHRQGFEKLTWCATTMRLPNTHSHIFRIDLSRLCARRRASAANYFFRNTRRDLRYRASRSYRPTCIRATHRCYVDTKDALVGLGGFKGEAQQRVNERKLKLSKQLRAYVRTPRMANEMHG